MGAGYRGSLPEGLARPVRALRGRAGRAGTGSPRPARQPAPMIAAMPPPTPRPSARPFRPSMPARHVARSEYSGETEEDDPEDHAAGRQQRDLRRVADGDRVEDEDDRADQRDGQEDDPGGTRGRAPDAVMPRPRRPGDRRPRCTTGADASVTSPRSVRRRRSRRPGTSAPRRSSGNVQKQWTTRTLNPPRRNGPSRRLSMPYSGRSPRSRDTSSRP